MKKTFRFKASLGLVGCEVTKVMTFEFDDDADPKGIDEEVDEALDDWGLQQVSFEAVEVPEGTKR